MYLLLYFPVNTHCVSGMTATGSRRKEKHLVQEVGWATSNRTTTNNLLPHISTGIRTTWKTDAVLSKFRGRNCFCMKPPHQEEPFELGRNEQVGPQGKVHHEQSTEGKRPSLSRCPHGKCKIWDQTWSGEPRHGGPWIPAVGTAANIGRPFKSFCFLFVCFLLENDKPRRVF